MLIEVNTTDADQLRNILKTINFPAPIGTQINISEANITTGKTNLQALGGDDNHNAQNFIMGIKF